MKKLLIFPFRKPGHYVDNDDGLTLIECLVAIAVIAVTSASIAPVLVLSVATRVQNQKAEQALQLAKGEVDRVRLLIERNPTYTSSTLRLAESASAPLPTPTSTASTITGTAITTVSAPTSLAAGSTWTASGYVPNALQAREIDTNGDNTTDFVIQSFRGEAAIGETPDMPIAFDIGVRVYDYNAITDNSGAIISGLLTDSASLGFTSGEGQRGRKPLAVLYTQIINSDDGKSLCDYMDYLQASVPVSMSCN